MPRINLDDLHPAIAWPLGLAIIVFIVWVGYQLLDGVADTSDSSPEVHEVVNDTKKALGDFKEGAETANDVRDGLDNLNELKID